MFESVMTDDDKLQESYHELAMSVSQDAVFLCFTQDMNGLVDRFTKNKPPFLVQEVSDEAVLLIEQSDSPVTYIQIGFPFPVYRIELSNSLSETPVSIKYCVRGEPIRRIQREYFIKSVGKQLSVLDDSSFVAKFSESAKTCRRILYVNPYRFLGDSFIGEYFRNAFLEALELPQAGYFSRYHEHISAIKDVLPINELNDHVAEGDLIVMPDLIDNHFVDTLQLVEKIQQKVGVIAVLGRNLFLDNSTQSLYFNQINDPILRNSNIQHYMDDCLKHFIPIKQQSICQLGINKKFEVNHKAVFINPFARLGMRDLPPELCANLIAALISQGANKITVSGGVPGVEKDHRKLNTLLSLLHANQTIEQVEIVTFRNLGELSEYLSEKQISVVLSPDTSIPHLTMRHGIPVLTFYHERFWDEQSIQSLTGDSPLGFCRFNANQIPVIFHEDRVPDIPTLVKLLAELESVTSSNDSQDAISHYLGLLNQTLQDNQVESNVSELLSHYEDIVNSLNIATINSFFDLRKLSRVLYLHPPNKRARLLLAMFLIAPATKLSTEYINA